MKFNLAAPDPVFLKLGGIVARLVSWPVVPRGSRECLIASSVFLMRARAYSYRVRRMGAVTIARRPGREKLRAAVVLFGDM